MLVIGAMQKYYRALEHLATVKKILSEYMSTEPYRIEQTELDNGDLDYVFRELLPIPKNLSLTVGDTIHNFRVCLDHLSCLAVEANGGTPTDQTSFPFTKDVKNLQTEIDRRLAGASDVARRFVRRLKPFKNGNSILWQLHRLDIIDKHRAILIAGSHHRNVTIQMRTPGINDQEGILSPPIPLIPADKQFPLENGYVLFKIVAAARSGPVPENPVFYIDFACEDADGNGGQPIIETLENIHKYIGKVISIFNTRIF